MNYKETLDYLFSQLPMFHRVGAAAYKADLSNTIALCKTLDNPENNLTCIHVAGTNGKGSVSHMLASIFQEAGYKTGLYTSPHLIDFRERIKINGKMIPEEYVIEFVRKYKAQFTDIQPSFFEWTVGLCFDYFRNEKVDIAIIETGLGGRLDSTNVITPLVSVITNISFDHQALLGDTLEKIAAEKAGIIKSDVPVVIGETDDKTKNVFLNKATQQKTEIVFADQLYKTEVISKYDAGRQWKITREGDEIDITCQLKGLYQGKNIKTVLASVEKIRSEFSITDDNIKQGLARVVDNTGLYGRWQTINHLPKIICDTGHNEAGISEILNNLKEEQYNKLHWIIGMVNDKDVAKVLSMLPKEAEYYFTKASIPRALPEKNLKEKAFIAGLTGGTYSEVGEAINAAKNKATAADLILIGGSTFIVGDALFFFEKTPEKIL